ncbi:MAG: pyridoxamine 5'-phosphate oxidase family protein [Parcubacteria group bacterium]|nr:pyridoxamine 5'-phosphate oxidase family protein [Parcubacteria group bacterium]
MKELFKFIKNQELMVIASRDEKDIWVANVYFSVDEKLTIYFISPKDTKHSQMILKNPDITFSIAWFDPSNHKNRKAVQGLGVCRSAKNLVATTTGIKLLYKKFPDLRDTLTVKWIMKNVWGAKVWVLEPTYIKYWDDELYGDNETEEFTFK